VTQMTETISKSDPTTGKTKLMPASTAWPIVLAFGVTLLFASLVTNPGVGLVGLLLMICGAAGWFRQVLPNEVHEAVPVTTSRQEVSTLRTRVAHIELGDLHRAHLPVESYPVMSGVRGGIAGGIAMILPALLFGYLTQHSIWYAVNLLGGAGVAHWSDPSTADIAAFHWNGLIVATIIHVATSVLVGLLYGAMLPMMPHRPILLGGIVAPVLWTGLLHSSLGFINPALNARIAWGWFALSQIAFGIVAGIVVVRRGRVRTNQTLPFLLRMGLEAPEFMHSPDEENKRS
jgi:hypothetical protein